MKEEKLPISIGTAMIFGFHRNLLINQIELAFIVIFNSIYGYNNSLRSGSLAVPFAAISNLLSTLGLHWCVRISMNYPYWFLFGDKSQCQV